MTSSISPGFAGPVFEDAHRGRVYVRMFIGVSARAVCVWIWNLERSIRRKDRGL